MRTSVARDIAIARKMTRLALLVGMAGAVTLAFADAAAVAQQVAPAAAQAPNVQTPKKTKQKPKTKPAASQEAQAAKKDPAAAQAQLDAGVASLQAGKADLAVQQFSSALTGGSLPPNLLARAHYQRGLAYRKQSKPALAISDLTQALWLKNGLNETERADALQNRIAAYRDAGLPDQDDSQGARSAGARTASAEPAPPAPTTSSIGSVGAIKPSASLAPAADSPPPQSSGGLGGFFGNLFGGSSNASEAATAAPAGKVEPVVSAWSSNTEVKPAAASRSVKPAAGTATTADTTLPWQQPEATAKATPAAKPTRVASAATAGAAAAGKAGSRYQLQVAQFKSAEEAQTAAARIKQQFIGELAGREASVTAVSAGGFGTLHRLSFGPFIDPAEWKALCPKLLSAGNDCQPLAQ